MQDNIEIFKPRHDSAEWRNDEITIVMLIYATITDELYDVVWSTDNTAYAPWTRLSTFHDNKPSCAIHASAHFCANVQGDMTIAAYCCKLKSLVDVGKPVSDR